MNYSQLEQLTKLIASGLGELRHRSIVALITQDVHARDILDSLCEEEMILQQTSTAYGSQD